MAKRRVGAVAVNLTARTNAFVRGMRKAAKSVGGLTTSVARGTIRVAKYGAGMAAVAVGGMTLLTKQSFTLIDAIAKTSDKLGIATEKLVGLHHAGRLTGVATNTMNMALQRMTRRLSEAAAGGGEAVKAIAELGLDARKLAGMAPDEAFRRIADALESVPSQADKVRLAFKLFDSEGVALVNTLALGSKGLDTIGKEAVRLGLAMNRVDAAKIEQANDAITRMKAGWRGTANTIAITVAPAITDILKKFNEWSDSGPGIAGRVEKAFDKLGEAAQWFANVLQKIIYGWRMMFATMEKGIAWVKYQIALQEVALSASTANLKAAENAMYKFYEADAALKKLVMNELITLTKWRWGDRLANWFKRVTLAWCSRAD